MQELHKQSHPEIAELLEKSFYIDDLLTGESNDGKALAIFQRAKKIMSEGSSNLRKWRTNSRELQRAIAMSESRTQSVSTQSEIYCDKKEDDETYEK